MLRRLMMAAGTAAPVSYIGAGTPFQGETLTLNLAVDTGAQDGDLMVVILGTNSARTFSGFTGWTSRASPSIGSARWYVYSKVRSGETSVSFTHSANDACTGMLLVFRNGAVLTTGAASGASATLTKSSGTSMLLALALNSGVPAPTTPTFSGYTHQSFVGFVSGSNRFFATCAETRTGIAAGSTTATMGWGGANRYAVLLEIG